MSTKPTDYGLKPALFNAVYAQADAKVRAKLVKGRPVPAGVLAALAIDAALACGKGAGGRALSESLVSWAARHMERTF